jgi:nucleoside-diphosphate-sugar epimerase
MFQNNNPDIVVHLAAKVGGIRYSVDNPATTLHDNTLMLLNLFNINIKYNAKIITASSACAYPEQTDIPTNETELWTGKPTGATGAYGVSKRLCQSVSEAYAKQWGAESLMLILTNLYGPGESFDLKNSHVTGAVIRKIHDAKMTDEPPLFWGTGNVTRDFLHVEDAARAFVLAAGMSPDDPTFNIGSGREVSIRELVRIVCEIADYDFGSVQWDTSQPDGQPRRCLDITRAKEQLGWQPTISLEDGLRKEYEQYRASQHRT